LYQEGKDINVTAKFIHVCNFPTAGSDTDAAFKNRVRVLKFVSTFISPEEYKIRKRNKTLKPYTYKTHPDADRAIEIMGPYFLALIVKYYNHFMKEKKLPYPDIIKNHTLEFLTHSNYPLKFIKKHIIKIYKDAEPIQAIQIYSIFKDWFKTNFPSYNVPTMETFSKQLNDEDFVEDENGYITNAKINYFSQIDL
jgi:phage/plasmid-associated DNA primase